MTTITDPDTGQEFEVDFRRWLSTTWADIVRHPNALLGPLHADLFGVALRSYQRRSTRPAAIRHTVPG